MGLLRTGLGRFAVAALALLGAVATSVPSLAAGRVALVIGNAAYQHTAPLRNPRNDADGVARSLRSLGFTVIEGLDLDEDAFETKLREFAQAASGADATLFYYAGHGLQVEGKNYLVPVDAELASEVDLRWDAIALENVLAEMRSEANLVFLDACRDNPLARSLARSMGSSRSSAVGRGLGPVETVFGTMIAYATQPGNTADDGEGEHSPFTEALLASLSAPGVSVNDLMTSVTDAVATRTKGRQQPWTHSSLRKPFYFNPAEERAAEEPPGDVIPPEAAGPDADASSGTLAVEEAAARAYEAAERLQLAEGYEVVVERFPESTYAELARAQIRILRRGLPPDPSSSPPGPETVELSLELDRSERRLVQVGLSSLGFEPGPLDGLFGRGARGAIVRLQLSRELAATGYLDVELSRELLVAGAEAVAAASAADDAAFAGARSSGSLASYASYLGAYPDGRHASEARRLRAEAEAIERLGPGAEFRECPGCPAMVVVPAGSFRMGSPAEEAGRRDDEGPDHHVSISRPFAVGKYEVARGEYGRFVSATGHSSGTECWTYEDGEWKTRAGRNWRTPGYTQTDSDPAVCVSWEDAQSYIEWLSAETGLRYRLLSESEWEYAARAGTTGPFHFGSTISTDQANYNGNFIYGSGRKGVYPGKTVPVGSFPPNGFGLHDMHGNVWEWVEDCWHETYSGAPSDGSAWTTGGDCSLRVLRGGSWISLPRFLRSAFRNWDTTSNRVNSNGFRVARTLTP